MVPLLPEPLLTTLILHRASYGLKGIYSLDEHYARDLDAYYRALTVGPSHNYYEGRAAADLTGFVGYFCAGMAEAFANDVRAAATAANARASPDQSARLSALDPRRRRLLELFRNQDTATAAEIAGHLDLSPRTVVALCRTWVAQRFLELADPGRIAPIVSGPRMPSWCRLRGGDDCAGLLANLGALLPLARQRLGVDQFFDLHLQITHDALFFVAVRQQ